MGRGWCCASSRAGPLLPSAHAIDREYRVISALHGTRFRWHDRCACAPTAVIGTMFYLMEYAAGRAFWDPTFPGMSAPQRAAIYDEMNRVIVALHTLDYAAAGLADYGKPGNYFARQIARWSRAVPLVRDRAHRGDGEAASRGCRRTSPPAMRPRWCTGTTGWTT